MAKQVFNPLSGTFDTVLSAAAELPYDNSTSGLTAANVQTAIDEVQLNLESLPDPITYQGTWNASTNNPALDNTDVGAAGHLYQVTVAGAVNFGAGSISFDAGDKVVNNGFVWEKWDMTDAVTSVNSQTGAVSLDTDDIPEGTAKYFSNAQAQAAIMGGASTITTANLTASRALASDASGKVAVSAVTDTELGYLSGVTSSVQTQLNAAITDPTTTKGDLFTRSSSTRDRLPVGVDGTFLSADSAQTVGLNWANPSGTQAIRSVTTTDTPSATDDTTLVCSGASFTITFPTPASGKIYRVIHNGTSLSQVYTLATTGGATIGGIASGSYSLYTNGEALEIQYTGTNFVILEHRAVTAWADAPTQFTTGNLITGVTTNPSPATTTQVSKARWARDGQNLVFRFDYSHSSNTGAAAGSGNYLVSLSAFGTIDTALAPVYTGANYYNTLSSSLGRINGSDTVNAYNGSLHAYSTTQLRAFLNFTGTSQGVVVWGSTGAAFSGTQYAISIAAIVPITGWQP